MWHVFITCLNVLLAKRHGAAKWDAELGHTTRKQVARLEVGGRFAAKQRPLQLGWVAGDLWVAGRDWVNGDRVCAAAAGCDDAVGWETFAFACRMVVVAAIHSLSCTRV